jgi:homoserine O-acetyltransferase/O-succinyltransferase
MRRLVLKLCFPLWAVVAYSQAQTALQPKEGDFVLRDFRFRSGEVLPELR